MEKIVKTESLCNYSLCKEIIGKIVKRNGLTRELSTHFDGSIKQSSQASLSVIAIHCSGFYDVGLASVNTHCSIQLQIITIKEMYNINIFAKKCLVI